MTVPTANRLASQTSPYLRQHAHNPVDWYPWGAEAWERARREQRPVLLSVGYAACHWCHVMERESFSDPATAEVMNSHFVCIKVDREERPDVDQLYQAAIGVLGVQGGWPLTVFLTPEQAPFFGGTYWPEAPRFGRPAFTEVLVRVAEAFRDRRAQVESSAAELRSALEGMASLPGRPADALDASLVATACEQLLTRWDAEHHGFGKQPRFPNTLLLELFLRRGLAAADGAAWRERALASFGAMARGGIHDAIGGGFHRYSTDAAWAVPHFEKMLYDNALLLRLGALLLKSAPESDRPQVAQALRDTALWLSREMTDESGAFSASQDADSADASGELEEGRFFVWRPAELEALLGVEDGRLAALLLSVTERGNFEGGASVPSRRASLEEVAASARLDPAEVVRRWPSIRERLYAARRERPRPAVDDKVLAAWNGLVIEGLAEAGAALGDEAMVAAAARAMEAVERLLVTPTGLRRSWRGVPSSVPAFADDYAALAGAHLALLRVTGRPHHLDRARALVDALLERFSDGEGGLYVTAHDAEALLERPRARYDEAVPSAVSLLTRALLELAVMTGEGRWQEAAERLLRRHASSMARTAFGHGGLLCAHDDAVRGLRLVLVTGPEGDPLREALLRTARAAVDPAVRVLPWTGECEAGPLSSVVQGKSETAAWICDLNGCRPPIRDSEQLATLLAG